MIAETESTHGFICPYCGHEDTDPETYGIAVTYWGDDGSPKTAFCVQCEKEYEVYEHVVRTWTSKPIAKLTERRGE